MRRLAALVAATPLVLGGTAHAQQRPLLDIVNDLLKGCYGAVVVVCDPHVSATTGSGEPTSVPVCAGSCTTVDVPSNGSGDQVCVGWTSYNGGATERCVPLYTDPA